MTSIFDMDHGAYIYSDNSSNMSQTSQDDKFLNSPCYSTSPTSSSSSDVSNLYNNIQSLNITKNIYNNLAVEDTNESMGQPYLHITEQPIDKFRFRYRSEMHGTHGSLMAQRSDKSKKIFPTVELRGYTGDAIIRCSLYQVEENKLTHERSQHSHKLVVRNGDEDREDPHDVSVSQLKGYAAVFYGMGIIHTAKKSIAEELYRKKKYEREIITKRELSSREDVALKNSAEEESKAMNLNQVCLCYQALKMENDILKPLCDPIYSNTINNMKSALTGELKIARLSVAVSSAAGGDDLFLFVEKVGKKNIRVRFYELNEDDQEIWEDWGKFTEADVHHQYAIALRTPPYRDVNITQNVDVFIQLHRINDGDRSEPLSFRYKPKNSFNSRKRPRLESNFNSLSSGSNTSSVEIPMTVTLGQFEQQLQQNDCDNNLDTPMTISELLGFQSGDFANFVQLGSDEYQKFLALDCGAPTTSSIEENKRRKLLISMEKERQLPGEILKKISEIVRQHRTDKAASKALIRDMLKPLNEDSGDNVIHVAIKYGNDNAIQKLLTLIEVYELYDLANYVNNLKENYLNFACTYDRYEYIKKLIGLGTNPNNNDYKGNTPLHNAVEEQCKLCIQKLLDAANYTGPRSVNIKIDFANHDGLTPLHYAIRKKNFEIVKILLENGASAKLSESKHGDNILHIAVYENAVDIVEHILKTTSIKINDVNNSGYTPLQIACASQNKSDTKIVELLLNHGANPELMNTEHSNQKPPIDVVVKKDNESDEDNDTDDGDDDDEEDEESPCNSYDLASNKPEILRVLHEFSSHIEIKKEILSEHGNDGDDSNDDDDDSKLVLDLKQPANIKMDATIDSSPLDDKDYSDDAYNQLIIFDDRTADELNDLYEIFNKTNKWQKIANLLDYDVHIKIWENSTNPTKMLFNLIELDGISFFMLISLLKHIEEPEAILIIKRMMKKILN